VFHCVAFILTSGLQNFRLSKYWWGGECCKLSAKSTLLGTQLSNRPVTAASTSVHDDVYEPPEDFMVPSGPCGTKRFRGVAPAVAPLLPGPRGEEHEQATISDVMHKLCEIGEAAYTMEQVTAACQTSHLNQNATDLHDAFPHVACTVNAAKEV
jgi:hypothetical protein